MDTLILSHTYEPIDHCPWQRAVTLWFIDKAEIIAEYADRVIRGHGWEMKMPSVIRLLKVVRRKKAIRFSRTNVYARDKGRCQYCAAKVTLPEATYDHVVPRAQGGKTEWTNVVIACVPCNQKKGGRTPAQAGMRLRSLPVHPSSLPEQAPRMPSRVPEDWKAWLRNVVYWNAELESG